MPGSTELTTLVRAVHAGIGRVEENARRHAVRSRLDDPLRRFEEAVDALAAAIAPRGARHGTPTQLEALLERLNRSCGELELVLSDPGIDETIAEGVLSLLRSCSELAIAVMDGPVEKALVSVA